MTEEWEPCNIFNITRAKFTGCVVCLRKYMYKNVKVFRFYHDVNMTIKLIVVIFVLTR